MAFPDIFINGSGNITSNQLVKINLDEWIQHIYYIGSGRVSKHLYLKFFLYNLNMRMKAHQGNFLVSQQLNDAHVTIDELMERMQNDDETLPRQITRIGSNLVNTDPYWNERKKRTRSLSFLSQKSL